MPLLRKKGFFETGRVLFLPICSLHPNPSQPRKQFLEDELAELAASIREHGILQPLSVRRASSGFELISGERRLRAAGLAGLTEVPCIVVDVDEVNSSLLALVENLQRRDLDFWEEALALERLITTCHLSQEEAARRIGKSQSAVANKLRLLKLPPEALVLLREHGMTERHARALLRIEDPALLMDTLRYAVAHHLTVAALESYIDGLLSPAVPRKRVPTYVIRDVRLFLNTVNRGLTLMKQAGVAAECGRTDTKDAILLTIRIPRNAQS
ncbi:MAG: ParB/RepB/Spo0J family partition protein [Intestinimonas sp.]|jgi:ParB family chromosome partitioning protein|nr:ParB/RepB/Spo0J family partition protein [Intestinimonas sp.]